MISVLEVAVVVSVFFSASGALIDISCETNGVMDHMTCRWINSHLEEPAFFYR